MAYWQPVLWTEDRTISDNHDITQLINDWRNGDDQSQDKLNQVVYDTLKRIARSQMSRERSDNTLQATVLVDEAYMQLVDADISWANSAHFRAVAAKMMRRTLIDHAREKNAQKRGGGTADITLMESRVIGVDQLSVLELDDVLNKLAAFDERKAKAIELTFFGGLNYEEVGEVLSISKATVERELRIAKAWLHNALQEGSE